MTKFIHTSDWQLGMTRHFLGDGAQDRYNHARFDCIRHIGRIAREEDCRFVVVCGDVFESNQVSGKTIGLALEALREVPVPVYLLPGNHDPLNDASVFMGRVFTENKPPHVTVVADGHPIAVEVGVEVVGAPWTAKRLAANPLHDILEQLPPAKGAVRVCLAHGAVDALAGFSDSPAVLSLAAMRRALDEGKAHFIALGDKHSLTRVDPEGRIWYSGTPEVTAFDEPEPGYVNVVELEADAVSTKRMRTGTWTFAEMEGMDLSGGGDVEQLLEAVEAVAGKERCVLRLTLAGLLGLDEVNRLEGRLAHLRELFASFEVEQRGLHCRVDAADSPSERFTGFAAETDRTLRALVAAGGPDADCARDALLTLMRLGGEDA